MVEHTLRTVHESLVQGYCATVDCATADCATVDCARLHDKRYYCITGKGRILPATSITIGVSAF